MTASDFSRIRRRKMKADVVVLTKNCANPIFEKCLSRVKQEISVNRLIVVDAYSADHNLNIVKQFFPDATILFDKDTRATARQKGIEAVETEWFVFIDSDVVLQHGWFKKVTSLIEPNVGLVIGREVPIYEKEIKQLKDALIKLKRKVHFRGSVFPFRAFMGDTLILTKAVKGIRIPSILHVYEDNYIQRFIESRGYKWKITEKPVALHYGEIYRKKDVVISGALGFLQNYLTFKRVVLGVFLVVPKGILVTLITKNPHLFNWLLYRWLTSFAGVLKAVVTYGFHYKLDAKPPLALDVGCGGSLRYPAKPRGTVNCDLELPKVKIPNFIRCDAHHLPFRDKCFTKITAFQVLEHCRDPVQVAKEMMRICIGKIVVTVPNVLSINQHSDETHVQAFTPPIFRKLFKNCKVKVQGYGGTWIQAQNKTITRIVKLLSYIEPFFAQNLRVEITVA